MKIKLLCFFLTFLSFNIVNKQTDAEMRRDIAVINGTVKNDRTTFIDSETDLVVSKCDDKYNPTKTLGFNVNMDNPLNSQTNLPQCAITKDYSGACWVQNAGFNGSKYKVKVCHAGNGYMADTSCVELEDNSKKGLFSTSKIKTFGYHDIGYTGGYEYGTDDCPDTSKALNSLGYVFLQEATDSKYKTIEDFYNTYCSPLIEKYYPPYCPNESKCPCDKECRENGFMPDLKSDKGKKISNSVKKCYTCHKQHRAMAFYCEKVYKCIHKNTNSDIYKLLTGAKRKKTAKLYGRGSYICGYYAGERCGCAKLQLAGGPRHFLRIAQKNSTNNNAGCEGSNIEQNPQCNLFEDYVKTREFYDQEGCNTVSCEEKHNPELGIENRGTFFFPKIIVQSGKNERLIGMRYVDKLAENPNYYYNTPITTGSLNNSEFNIPTSSSIYFSNFYPEIFTIGSTYRLIDEDGKYTNKPTGFLYFIVLRLEYNIATGLSNLVAYEVRPVQTEKATRYNADGSIRLFTTVRVNSKGKRIVDDFTYNYDPDKNIAHKTLIDNFGDFNKYKYLQFTNIGSIERPPIMYSYDSDRNYLNSPISISQDYEAIRERTNLASEMVKITLSPYVLKGLDEKEFKNDIKLPEKTESLIIRGINASAYNLVSGDLKYSGDQAINNTALLYMKAFTVDYINPCVILQNFNSSETMAFLKTPPEDISICQSQGTAEKKLACYTSFQLARECNAYEHCLKNTSSILRCENDDFKNPKLKLIGSDANLEDYYVNKDWRSSPKICVIGGFDFAEHLGEMTNTYKFGYFGNPIYDYVPVLSRPKNTIFGQTETIPITTLGRPVDYVVMGTQQIENKYILPMNVDYFHEKDDDKFTSLKKHLSSQYIFSKKTYKKTNTTVLDNYFPDCKDNDKKCKDKIDVRIRTVDETNGRLCMDSGSIGSGAWSNLKSRDLGTDYDVYIPYRCQFVDFSGYGAGGGGLTTENGTNCMTTFQVRMESLNLIEGIGEIRYIPKYDATGGGGAYLQGVINLNKINIFDGYLHLRIGSATKYARHTLHTMQSGNTWCYVGTSANVSTLNGNFHKNADWIVAGGSHEYWDLNFNSYAGNEGSKAIYDKEKGNTKIWFTLYDNIGKTISNDTKNKYENRINELQNEIDKLQNKIDVILNILSSQDNKEPSENSNQVSSGKINKYKERKIEKENELANLQSINPQTEATTKQINDTKKEIDLLTAIINNFEEMQNNEELNEKQIDEKTESIKEKKEQLCNIDDQLCFDENEDSEDGLEEDESAVEYEQQSSLLLEYKAQKQEYEKEITIINTEMNKYGSASNEQIALLGHGGSPIDCRIKSDNTNCPYIVNTGAYTTLGTNFSGGCLNPFKKKCWTVKAQNYTIEEKRGKDYFKKNLNSTRGNYQYNEKYFTGNIQAQKGNGSDLSQREGLYRDAKSLFTGKNYYEIDKYLQYFKNSTSRQSTDELIDERFNVYNPYISEGGAFNHRKSTGSGGQGSSSLSVGTPKIKYKTENGITMPDLNSDGTKKYDATYGKIDTSCSVRCPPIYREIKNQTFILPNGDDIKVDLICEYIGIPETDMEVDNATTAIPKKCYITSDTSHKDYGNLKWKIIRNEDYCPISKCINGTWGFLKASKEEDKISTQFDRRAIMCKYNASGYEKNKTYSSYYYSMMFNKNIYAAMPFEGGTYDRLYSSLNGGSFPLAECASNQATDYISDLFENLNKYSLTCGNGFWQIPHTSNEAQEKTSLYTRPTTEITRILKRNASGNTTTSKEVVKYFDEARDNEYINNNKPMWYTEWTVDDLAYKLSDNKTKTTGIKKLDEYVFSEFNDIKTGRFVLKAKCPPIDADRYDFDATYSGNAVWEPANEKSDTVIATKCATGDRYAVIGKNADGRTVLPTRRCMRNGIWGPVFNPCIRVCPDETDEYGIYWSMYDKENDAENFTKSIINGETIATVKGTCSGNYLNSLDYITKNADITRICYIDRGTWEQAKRYDCEDKLLCIADENSSLSVFTPYPRTIKLINNNSFNQMIEAVRSGRFGEENVLTVEDSVYLVFDKNKKHSSQFGFDYYQAINKYISVNVLIKNDDEIEGGYYMLDKNGKEMFNLYSYDSWYIIEVSTNVKPKPYSYMLGQSSSGDTNEFLNIHNWIEDLKDETRNFTNYWSFKCNLSRTNFSSPLNTRSTALHERYKNTKLIVMIPISEDNNRKTTERISIFSPYYAKIYAESRGINANSLNLDDTSIKFRVPLSIPDDMIYSVSSFLNNDNIYPNSSILDDYPMIVYNGGSSSRVYDFIGEIGDIENWRNKAVKNHNIGRDCNGKYIGFIKHNTLKHTMYTQSPDADDIFFISAFCYDGHIFGYHGLKTKFSQSALTTITEADAKGLEKTPTGQCFMDNFIDKTPQIIYNYITEKFDITEDTNLYSIHKNSYIAAMFLKFWKAQIQPEAEKREYFSSNYYKQSASEDEIIQFIYGQYKLGDKSRYYRVVTRRADWIIDDKSLNTDITIQELIKLDDTDPYCLSIECTNQKTESNTFNSLTQPDNNWKISERTGTSCVD